MKNRLLYFSHMIFLVMIKMKLLSLAILVTLKAKRASLYREVMPKYLNLVKKLKDSEIKIL